MQKSEEKLLLFDVCMDWYVVIDLVHQFAFPTEITLSAQHQDIVNWSVNLRKVFVLKLMVPFEENIDWVPQLKKYEHLRE